VKPHVFHPEAEAKYTAAVEYYQGIDPVPGNRFFNEMERVIQEIRRNPEWY
jgi:hypothetical protein